MGEALLITWNIIKIPDCFTRLFHIRILKKRKVDRYIVSQLDREIAKQIDQLVDKQAEKRENKKKTNNILPLVEV